MNTETSIHQLVYNSRATYDLAESELGMLLVKAREKNDALNITGVLSYREGSFVQALEGPRIALEQLYQTILEDSRHTDIHTLFQGTVGKREFGSWPMGVYLADGHDAEDLVGFQHFLRAHSRRAVHSASACATLLTLGEEHHQQWPRTRVAGA